jgi:adenylate cyclase
VLAVGYLLFNGIFLFDFMNYVVPVGSPLIAALTVLSFGAVVRAVQERAEVKRVTRSFGKYVDPQLVKTVLEGNAELKGKRKELTVVFTDLAGFTNLSEQLGPRIVPLLNDYFGRMVPVVRKNDGYLNKFIGDAMMFFYGDPKENAFHASKAVQTVLDMQEVMPSFNQSLVAQGLAPVSFRAGICSGPMIVGDAGSLNAQQDEDRASDYTVLGDNVNLASRLEGANKFFGTHVLMNERTRELIGDRFLVRPVGRMQVKGQSVGVMTYEPLALKENAAADQIRLAQLTEDVVLPFLKGEFEQCLRGVETFESELGPSKLTTLYRDLSAQYLKEPPAAGFAGQITLTEK